MMKMESHSTRKAEFVSYKGSKPMNIIWKLEEAIPSNFINKTNKLVAR